MMLFLWGREWGSLGRAEIMAACGHGKYCMLVSSGAMSGHLLVICNGKKWEGRYYLGFGRGIKKGNAVLCRRSTETPDAGCQPKTSTITFS